MPKACQNQLVMWCHHLTRTCCWCSAGRAELAGVLGPVLCTAGVTTGLSQSHGCHTVTWSTEWVSYADSERVVAGTGCFLLSLRAVVLAVIGLLLWYPVREIKEWMPNIWGEIFRFVSCAKLTEHEKMWWPFHFRHICLSRCKYLVYDGSQYGKSTYDRWICIAVSVHFQIKCWKYCGWTSKPKCVVKGLSWTELSYLISVYWHFEFWAFPSCMEWWNKVYSITLIAIFSGSGLIVCWMFLEVKYWSPGSCALIPFHNQKWKLPASHDFCLTKDVLSVANAMNGPKNLISPAANSFDRCKENKVFLYPGHSQVSSKICIVST